MFEGLKQIVTAIDRTQPWYSFAYTGGLFTLCALALFSADWSAIAGTWPRLAFFVALSTAAEILYVQLPLGKGRISVGFATTYGAILLLQPHEAAVAAGAGVAIVNLMHRLAADVIVFNAAQIAVSTGLTGLLWQVLRPAGALVPVASEHVAQLVAALFACALVYYVVNALLVAIGISLAYRMPMREVVSKDMIWVLPNHFALGSLGFLIAVLYLNVGVYGVLLLWIPLLIARYSYQQYINVRDAHLETIHALASALDAKDPYTKGHSDRVAHYAVEIGRQMRLDPSELEVLRYAGILHDIGKIAISDTVLNKVGRLTEEEFQLAKSHPVIGANLNSPVRFLKGVEEVVRHHHERWDGRGYPDGLVGEEIPLGARIVAVADAFDAMTHDRVYRVGMPPEAAVKQLLAGRGTQFDPDVVDTFVEWVLPEHIGLTQYGSGKRPAGEAAAEGGRPAGEGLSEGDWVWKYVAGAMTPEDRPEETAQNPEEHSPNGVSCGGSAGEPGELHSVGEREAAASQESQNGC